LGTRTWPAYCAAGITAAYGLLKAYWVFGGTALWSIAPLPQELIDKLQSHTAPTWFVVADAASMVLAGVGVFFALATVRPRRWLPVWLVRWLLWPLATFMVLRGMLGILGDVPQIASGESGAVTHTALWDLGLWAPLFLTWGLLWAATALTYIRRVRTTRERVARAARHPHTCAHALAVPTHAGSRRSYSGARRAQRTRASGG